MRQPNTEYAQVRFCACCYSRVSVVAFNGLTLDLFHVLSTSQQHGHGGNNP